MKIIHRMTLAAASLCLAITSAYALEGDATAGQQAAAVCAACHQPNGAGMNIQGGESWPKLAALDATYLHKQLHDIKAGTRQSPTMMPFVSMLNEQQLKDVSVYYSQLPAIQGQFDAAATEEELAHGEKLAMEGDWDRYIVPCMKCHGPDNLGVGEAFPKLAGQHAGYIADQLHAWQTGKRDNDPQHLMVAIAERMNDKDIRAVSQWLSRQPAQR
ncbi:MAG TPA: c-type cytochrome [Thiopseudomonas sp.]|nr:c-type cytochrome [Thiopseudomonas sp.]